MECDKEKLRIFFHDTINDLSIASGNATILADKYKEDTSMNTEFLDRNKKIVERITKVLDRISDYQKLLDSN